MIPFSLIAAHFAGDFLLQSDWMALNKSKHWDVLTLHVAVYSATFAAWGIKFVALTFLLHWVTDFYTSRLTSKLWFIDLVPIDHTGWIGFGGKEFSHFARILPYRHWFFVAIGADQLIHYASLMIAYRLFA